MERRKFLSGAAAIGATAAAGTAVQAKPAPDNLDRFAPKALEPEFKVDTATGKIERNPNQRVAFARCFGCLDHCNLRVRVDVKTDKVIRVSGNPYCENNSGKPLPLEMPVKEAMLALSAFQDRGLDARATSCGRGSATADSVDEPRRITQVLKRVGKRGERQWKSIPYEQALSEIIEGGNLFGDGHVKGLREVYQPDQLAAPGQPEFGPATNRLASGYMSDITARADFYTRFMKQSWGTINLGKKSAYCGAQQRLGVAMALIDPLTGAMHNHPDWNEAKFAIFLGTSPGVSGNSLNSLGRLLADARVDHSMKYVVVDPILRATSNTTKDGRSSWLPINPGEDTAFLFGVMHEIFARESFNRTHLENPGPAAAKATGEIHHTNATHLLVRDPKHPLYNKFLRADALGLGDAKTAVAICKLSKTPFAATEVKPGDLFFKGTVKDKDGKEIAVETALSMFRAHIRERSIEHYAEVTGIGVADLRWVAKEFTSHGRKASVMLSTASNNHDGFVTGFAVGVMNTLIGAHDAKGGATYARGTHRGKQRYALAKFEGAKDRKTLGVSIGREGFYEKSTEYAKKVAAGKNPYPAAHPWMAIAPVEHTGEILVSHANRSPYALDIFFNWRTNPFYMNAGMYEEVVGAIKDPKQTNLFVAIDAHLNETNELADYFIPDLNFMEEYAADRMWGSDMKGVSAGAPVVTPRTVKTAKGEHVCMERFLIDIALTLKLPGFGKGAVADDAGGKHDLFTPEDYYAKHLANIALDGKPLPPASTEDLEWSGAGHALQKLKGRVSDDELLRVGFLLSRGGRYDAVERYDGEFLSGFAGRELRIYNEKLSEFLHSYSGARYEGHPAYHRPRFWSGESLEKAWPRAQYPLLFSSFKPALRSPYSVSLAKITALAPEAGNHILLNSADAAKFGIESGDKVKITTPVGRSALGTALADTGVKQGAVSIPIGFGHRGFGGSDIVIDDRKLPALKERAAGTSVNEMLPGDPSRSGASLLIDYYTGCTCRHGTPVKVEKV